MCVRVLCVRSCSAALDVKVLGRHTQSAQLGMQWCGHVSRQLWVGSGLGLSMCVGVDACRRTCATYMPLCGCGLYPFTLAASPSASNCVLAATPFLRARPVQAIVTLRRQYRMARDIMSLSNALVYNGALLCGSEAVAEGRLRLPRLLAARAEAGAPPSSLPGWVLQVGGGAQGVCRRVHAFASARAAVKHPDVPEQAVRLIVCVQCSRGASCPKQEWQVGERQGRCLLSGLRVKPAMF